MQYQLNVNIDATGVSNINNAGQYVTLVQGVVSDPLPNLPISWISFTPFDSNIVTWTEDYYLYATTTAIQSGATITMTSQTAEAANLGYLYTFQEAGFGSGAPDSNAPSTFNVTNAMSSDSLSFGLAQQATVNGTVTTAPLNAVSVLSDESASFTPEVTVSIFLSSYSNNGSVISQVASNALVVTLTSQSPTADIGFDDSTNTFYLVTSSSAAAQRRRVA